MQSITSVETLREAIVTLKNQWNQQELELASHLTFIYESLRPVNIIKNVVRDLSESPGIQYDIVNMAVGLVSGYVSRKFFVSSRSGPLRKILGAALQLGVTNLAGKISGSIKTGGLQFLRSFLVSHNDNGSR